MASTPLNTAPRASVATGISLVLPISLSTMGSVLLAPIIPKLFEQFHDLPNANYWIPSLLTVPALCIALFSPLVGLFADRLGRRPILVVAMLVYAVMGLAPLVLDNFFAILATRVGVGLCEAVVMVCTTALIGDCFDDAGRDRWLGRQAATASLTALAFFPISGYLGEVFGWRGPFAVYGSSLVFLVGIVLFTWEPPRAPKPSAAAVVPTNAVFPWSHMLKVCGLSLIGGILFFIVQFQMASAMHSLGVTSSATTGWLIFAASVGVPVGAFSFGYVKRLLSFRTLLLIEFGVMAVTLYLMGQMNTPASFVVPAFFNQIGAGLMLPTLLTWAMQPLAFQVRGRGAGMWQSTFAIAQFLSTLSFSFVFSQVQGIQPSLAVFSGLAVVGFVIVLLLRNGRAHHAQAVPHVH
jgi:MFS family permease